MAGHLRRDGGRRPADEARREGREVLYTVRTEPLDQTARWMAGLATQWEDRLAAIKRLAEER